MCNNELEHVPDEKDLGVTIDGELNFDEHMQMELMDKSDTASLTLIVKH